MKKAGGGKRQAGRGPTPFAQVMREQGMAAPAALEESIRQALGDSTEQLSAPNVLTAAEQLLNQVLAEQCESRDAALDLLTVDALVTRAMEIAARDERLLADFPEQAMKRIAGK